MGVITKKIIGFDSYSISVDGDCISFKNVVTNNEIKQRIDKDGYLTIQLYDENKNRFIKKVHRIIYENIIIGRELLPNEIIDHIDMNRKNNNINNLRLVNRFQNTINNNNRKMMLCVNINNTSECFLSDAVSLLSKIANVKGVNLNDKITMKKDYLIVIITPSDTICDKYIEIFNNNVGFIENVDINDFNELFYTVNEMMINFYRKFMIKKATLANGDVIYFRNCEDFLKRKSICSLDYLKRILRDTPTTYNNICFEYVDIINHNYL